MRKLTPPSSKVGVAVEKEEEEMFSDEEPLETLTRKPRQKKSGAPTQSLQKHKDITESFVKFHSTESNDKSNKPIGVEG